MTAPISGARKRSCGGMSGISAASLSGRARASTDIHRRLAACAGVVIFLPLVLAAPFAAIYN
jgi:hypothetical protein